MNEAVQLVQAHTDATERHSILKLHLNDGKTAWLHLTEQRKAYAEGSGKDCRTISDRIELNLRSLGSDDYKYNNKQKVMEMKGEVNTFTGTIKFSNGYIVVEDPWKSLGIGTYMMNILVTWALKDYSDLQPTQITLLANQAITTEDKERRNRFYDQFGFRFVWGDPEHKTGHLAPDQKVSDLNTVTKWEERIEVMSIEKGLQETFWENLNLRSAADASKAGRLYADEQRSHAETKAKLANRRNWLWGAVGIILGILVAKYLGF